jgi:hypothetical protein
MGRTIELPRTDRSKTILTPSDGAARQDSPRVIALPRTKDSAHFIDLSAVTPASGGVSAKPTKPSYRRYVRRVCDVMVP